MTLDKTYTVFVRNHKDLLKYMKHPAYDIQKISVYGFWTAVISYTHKDDCLIAHPFYNPILAAMVTTHGRVYLYENGIDIVTNRLLYTGNLKCDLSDWTLS